MTATFPQTVATLPISAVPAYSVGADTAERFLILSPRVSDAGTLTASSEVSSLPAANLQTMQPARKWRSDGATSVTLTLATETPVAADILALCAHNLSDMAILRVLSTSLGLDTGWQSAWPSSGKPVAPSWPSLTSLLRWTAPGEASDWEIRIDDPSAEQTEIEAGRLMLGQAWQPTTNIDIGGSPLGFDPVDVQTRTPYGRTFTDRRDSPARTFEVSCYALNQREAFDGLYELQRLHGLWGDVVCCLRPGASTDFHRFTMQGVFTDRGAYTLPPAFDADGSMFGAAIRLRELI